MLFTRDLRVHDLPALVAAARADELLPLFVLDDAILGSDFAAPNRVAFLLDSLTDLRAALRARGSDLVVRRGDTASVVAGLAADVDATAVHASADVSGFASRRDRRLRSALGERGAEYHPHAGVTVVDPGALSPTGGDHYKVFTPYWRVWREARLRPVEDAPGRLPPLPAGVAAGEIPSRAELVDGEPSPELLRGGETLARQRMGGWIANAMANYPEDRDVLANDGTSHLSPYIHFGNLSPRELVARIDQRRRGGEDVVRQLCWRDFHHQVTWAHGAITTREYRPRGDDWHQDTEAFEAWTEGRTGYPIVDAGMRQLKAEGWMHNRARMITASFLVKDLYVDWRLGAGHFMHWLVDGDIANNYANWQWVAGTGTDTRPNRVYNPTRQGERFDRDGAYVRRWVPELAHIEGKRIHTPWELDDTLFGGADYPKPLVDHAEAAQRFLDRRGA